MSAGKSSLTNESATMPCVPPTSSAGTINKALRPTASIARGPPFIGIVARPNRASNRALVRAGSSAPITRRFMRSEDGGALVSSCGVAISTSTPSHARGCRNAI